MNSNARHKYKYDIIKKNSEIKEILENGKKIYTKYGVFFLDDKKNVDNLRFAVLIKKRVGNAVKRNYCKRIVRTYIRNRKTNFSIKNRVIFVYMFDGIINYNLLEIEFDKKLKFL